MLRKSEETLMEIRINLLRYDRNYARSIAVFKYFIHNRFRFQQIESRGKARVAEESSSTSLW